MNINWVEFLVGLGMMAAVVAIVGTCALGLAVWYTGGHQHPQK